MFSKASIISAAVFVGIIISSNAICSLVIAKDYDPELHDKILPLSPEDSLKTMVVQDGYSMEIVAAEPLVEEPVTMA